MKMKGKRGSKGRGREIHTNHGGLRPNLGFIGQQQPKQKCLKEGLLWWSKQKIFRRFPLGHFPLICQTLRPIVECQGHLFKLPSLSFSSCSKSEMRSPDCENFRIPTLNHGANKLWPSLSFASYSDGKTGRLQKNRWRITRIELVQYEITEPPIE